MQINEFIEVTSRVERYFEKEYTTEQRKIMYEQLRGIDVKRYIDITTQCLKTCKFLPKLADIFKAKTDISEVGRNDFKRSIVHCDKCAGTGYVLFSKIICDGNKKIAYSYSAKCTCENAIYANKKIATYQELGIEIGNRMEQAKNYIKSLAYVKDLAKKMYVGG